MGRDTIAIETDWAALHRFANRLNEFLGAERVLLFGSRARGDERRDSDYDLIVISPQFEHVKIVDRGRELYAIWRDVGGYGPIDLICVTPEEFEAARHRITLIAAVLPEAVDLLPKS